jgi:predicted regulator of Ras-like GTPase activity (Roadblock/LC7/MglB family)
MKREEVLVELDNLLGLDDVLACMLVKKGLEGIVPKKTKVKNIDLWKLIHETTNDLFLIVEKFFAYKLERLNLELNEYVIVIAPLSKAFALIVVIPSLANMGLLDVEIENTKRKIREILKRKDESGD